MGGHRLPLLQPTLTARAPLRAAVFGNLDLGNLQGWPRDPEPPFTRMASAVSSSFKSHFKSHELIFAVI